LPGITALVDYLAELADETAEHDAIELPHDWEATAFASMSAALRAIIG
jgi:hypothetical protein